jgi:chromate transporter
LRGVRALGAALAAVTAAVVGVILNLAVWFGIHVIFRETVEWHGLGLKLGIPALPSVDVVATILAIAAAVAIFRFKVAIMHTLLACSLVGWCCSSPSGWCHDIGQRRQICTPTAIAKTVH